MTIVAAVVMLGVLIFVHELGHFLVAKRSGVGVLKFSLGFGPKLVGVKRGETEYLLSALPLGGYVKMIGEDPGDESPEAADPQRSFSRKSVGTRAGIILAGPLANLLLPVVIFWGVFAFAGQPYFLPILGTPEPGSPAAQAGLLPGDRVTALDGRPIERWDEIEAAVQGSSGRPLTLTMGRDGRTFDVRLAPRTVMTRDIFGQETPTWDLGLHALISTRIGQVLPGHVAEQAGLRSLVFVEIDKNAQGTLKANRQLFHCRDAEVLGDITELSPDDVMDSAGIRPGQVALVSAGPPCQSFSTAGRRGSITDPRGSLFNHFVEMVGAIQPRFFVFENVRGILSAALRHRPLHLRGQGHPPLDDDEELGSVLRKVILPSLRERLGYEVVYALVNAADYGVPQVRWRALFLGSRDKELGSSKWSLEGEEMPLADLMPPTHAGKPGGGQRQWLTLGDALRDLAEDEPDFIPYSPSREAVLRLVPPGKNWRYLRDTCGHDYLKKVMGGAYDASGGKVGFWRRLTFDKPCPTVPASPIQKGTCLCHPEETRPLSVGEYARIQQFPDDYVFKGATAAKYTQIGNAVPVGLGRAVGEAVVRLIARTKEAGSERVTHATAAATG